MFKSKFVFGTHFLSNTIKFGTVRQTSFLYLTMFGERPLEWGIKGGGDF